VTTNTPPDRGIINGMLSIVIDPARLSARDSMMSEIDAMIAWVKSAKPSDPELPVLVAGEPERMARTERLANGIEIDKETWSQLSAIAQRYQIALDR
jgi:hydroxycarboxylate dehydrogenase B